MHRHFLTAIAQPLPSGVRRVIENLRKSWRLPANLRSSPDLLVRWSFVKDWGKPNEHGFYELERFWAEELVDDLPAAKLGRPGRHGSGDLCPVPLAPLASIAMFECYPAGHPAIWMLRETSRSMDARYEDAMFTLCFECRDIGPVP